MGHRRVDETATTKRCVKPTAYYIHEGYTELGYMRFFEESNDCEYQLKNIIKENTIFRNETNRHTMISLLADFIESARRHETSLTMQITSVLTDYCDYVCELDKKVDRDKLCERLAELLNPIRDRVKMEDGNSSEYGHSIDVVRTVSEEEIPNRAKQYRYCGNLPEMPPSLDTDRFLIIFDRDYYPGKEWCGSDSRDVFLENIHNCMNKGIEPMISTPAFEMWLLMHHKDAKYTKIKPELPMNAVNRELNKLEGRGNDKDDIKSIPKIRFNRFYKTTFKTAYNTSMKFAIDPVELENNIGSNVGIVLKSLLKETPARQR